jgi:hypothetical protein
LSNNDNSSVTQVEENLSNTSNEQEETIPTKQIEKIGSRKFPKVKDIYQDGNNEYLFDMDDIKTR